MAEEIDLANLKFTKEEINRVLYKNWKSFENAFDLGCFQVNLPNEIRRSSVVEAVELSRFSDMFGCSG